jgi:hypothetical protein
MNQHGDVPLVRSGHERLIVSLHKKIPVDWFFRTHSLPFAQQNLSCLKTGIPVPALQLNGAPKNNIFMVG